MWCDVLFQNTVVQVKQTEMMQNRTPCKTFCKFTKLFFSFQGIHMWMQSSNGLPGKRDNCDVAKILFMHKYVFCIIQIYCRKHFSVSLPHQLNFQIWSEKWISPLPAYSPTQTVPSLCLYFFWLFPLLFISRNRLKIWKMLHKIKLYSVRLIQQNK